MQDRFANRDKTGTARLSGREVLVVGWLVCLGKREFPVDPHRDPRAEKNGAETVEQSIPTGVEIPQQTSFIPSKARGRRPYPIFTRMRPLVRVQQSPPKITGIA